jgi:WD40 repeat protein
MNTPEVKRLHRHMLPTAVLSVDAQADGKTLYAACMDGVYEVNGETGEHRRLYGHESYASGVALLEGARILVSAGYDGTLTWCDLAAGKPIRTVKAHNFWSWQLARSPDGKYVASVTGQYLCGGEKYEPAPEQEPSVKVFDAASGTVVQALSHVPSVQSVAFSPDGRHVAAGNLMGEVRVWELPDGKQVAGWTTDAFTSWGIIKSHCYLGGVFALAFTPDGSELLLAGMGPMRDPMAGNGRQLWQRFAWRESPPRKVDETHAGESGEGLMEALAVHPTAGWFAMAGRLRGGQWNTGLFDLKSGALRHSLKTDSRVTRALFTAGGSRLVLGGTQRQPSFKEGKIAPFGHVDVYEVQG